jgi:glycogen debranching enzyme
MRPWILAIVVFLIAPRGIDAQGVPKFEVQYSPIQLEGPARQGIYLGGVGRAAAYFGQETGSLEAWAWPVKLLHEFELSFKIDDYSEPIPGASVARRVIVRPELMTVVYSHATFTVKQHLLVPLHEPGVIVLLDVEAVKPLEIVASFKADLDLMWPAGIGGQYAFWWNERKVFLLSESRREYNGYIGSPFAYEGSTHPAHAAPDAPSVFKVPVDPETTGTHFIPIVIAGGIMPRDTLNVLYERLLANAEHYYIERLEHARHIREDFASVQTPDPSIDLALEWAKVNLDESLACNPDLGCGMVAGYGPSGRGRRPGFGWFFGGDASINILGLLPYGGFAVAKAGLDFQRRYRRASDGKLPHEVTQSAMRTREDWFEDFPYGYYHADTTPYWVVALWQYFLQTADTAFVHQNWPAVIDAYRWGLSADTDGDMIADNTGGGLGAVEVGAIGAGLHQDIYLAGVWVASLRATADLAMAMDETELAREASANLDTALRNLDREYYVEDDDLYAFGVLEGGRTNAAITVWPATALSFGLLDLDHAQGNLDALASHQLLADWGARMLSADNELFDPMQYNMGTVWGFVTGFASWAMFNYDRPQGGFAALWANTRSTFYDALGRNPELQSGAYRRTLDTTVPHQFFATSMIPTPLFRGLFGLAADAPAHLLLFAPRLPGDWESAAVRNYPIGSQRIDVEVERLEHVVLGEGDSAVRGSELLARFRLRDRGSDLSVRFAPTLPPGSRVVRVAVNDRPVEFEELRTAFSTTVDVDLSVGDYGSTAAVFYEPGISVAPRRPEPAEGSPSREVRIISYTYDDDREVYLLRVEGRGGQTYNIDVVSPWSVPSDVSGGQLSEAGSGRYTLYVRFDGEPDSWQIQEIRFRN